MRTQAFASVSNALRNLCGRKEEEETVVVKSWLLYPAYPSPPLQGYWKTSKILFFHTSVAREVKCQMQGLST